MVGGTTGTAAPTHTDGLALDGQVVWRFIGTGAVGGVSSGWNTNNFGGVFSGQAAKVALPDGTIWQAISVYNVTTACELAVPTATTYNAGLTAGAPYDALAELIVLGGAGNSKVVFQLAMAGTSTPSYNLHANAFPDMTVPRRFVQRSPRFHLRAGVTSVQPRWLIDQQVGKAIALLLGNVAMRAA